MFDIMQNVSRTNVRNKCSGGRTEQAMRGQGSRVSFAVADGISRNEYYKIRGCGSASEFRRYLSASRAKRQRQLRRHCILLAAAAACIVLFICFLVFGIHSDASSSDSDREFKYYTSVTVGSEQSFDDVIDQYYDADHYKSRNAYAEEVCDINGLYSYPASAELIRPGDHLIVAYYSPEFH